MLSSKELAQQQLEEATRYQGGKRAKPVKPAAKMGLVYNAELQKMLKAIRKDIRMQLIPAIELERGNYIADAWIDTIAAVIERLRRKWQGEAFSQWAKTTASSLVTRTSQINRERFIKSLPKGIEINVFDDEDILEYMSASAYENARLIKSIPEKYLNQVEAITVNNMRAGIRPSAIVSQLVNQFGVESKRARMIARDQTAKINGDIVKKRQQKAGFVYFKWQASRDERTRTRHTEISQADAGYGPGIYRWDDLPKSSDGRPIHPGSDYQCRCVAIPLFKFEVEGKK